MRVHHLNCTSMCPLGGSLMDGRSRGLTATLVCHCLLLETSRDGLVLIDTGFGRRDVQAPEQRLPQAFRALLRPQLSEQQTAAAQVEALGFSVHDVRNIVLTHLDFDHAGGLDDFPEASVHLMADERDQAKAQRTSLDRQRFRPQQWSSNQRWVSYNVTGERWFDFDCVRAVQGMREEVLLVPLRGHTFGHAGIAVRTAENYLLHCGDAYFHAWEMTGDRYHCPPGLRAYQKLMEVDRPERLRNQARLRELAVRQQGTVQLFCAHDANELTRLRVERQQQQTSEGALSPTIHA